MSKPRSTGSLLFLSGVEIESIGVGPAEVITALVILNDPQTGLPLAVMDGNWITAWRTAGVSVLATRLLARKGADTLGCPLKASPLPKWLLEAPT